MWRIVNIFEPKAIWLIERPKYQDTTNSPFPAAVIMHGIHPRGNSGTTLRRSWHKVLSYTNKWNNNHRSVKWGMNLRSFWGFITDSYCVDVQQHTIRPQEISYFGCCWRLSEKLRWILHVVHLWVFVEFLLWCTVLMKLRSLDKQPILSSWWPAAAFASLVFYFFFFCCLLAWSKLSFVFYLFHICFLLFFTEGLEMTELWFQSATWTFGVGRRYIPLTNTQQLYPGPVGSDTLTITERPVQSG